MTPKINFSCQSIDSDQIRSDLESNEKQKKVDSLTPKSPPTFEESTSESTFLANHLILLPKADDSDCFPELWGGNQNAEHWESHEKPKKI